MTANRTQDPEMSVSSEDVFPGLLLQAATRFSQHLDNSVAGSSEVNTPYIWVLYLIACKPGIRQGLCADSLGFDATTFGRYIDRLVKDGLVLREVPEQDRRSITLMLTEEGTAAIEGCSTAVQQLHDDIRTRMGEEEWEKLSELLERFLDVYDHPLPQILRRHRSNL